MYRISLRLSLLYGLAALANGFNFTYSKPAQCDNLIVDWSGGQPPFRLLPGGTLRNISIPTSAFQGNTGLFSTQLNIHQDTKLILAMSDATGLTSGGISEIEIVAPSTTGASCNTTDPGVDFFFSLDGNLQQCKSYPFTQYDGAVQPITILALIPLGQSFVLNPPIGSSFVWNANISAGTPITFSMTDSLGRAGGTSDIFVAASSNDSTCLVGSSATATSTGSQTSTGSSAANTGSSIGSSDSRAKAVSPSIIAGASVAGLLVFAAAAFFVYFCFIRRRQIKSHPVGLDLTYDPAGAPAAPERATYLLPDHYTTTPLVAIHPHSSSSQNISYNSTASHSDARGSLPPGSSYDIQQSNTATPRYPENTSQYFDPYTPIDVPSAIITPFDIPLGATQNYRRESNTTSRDCKLSPYNSSPGPVTTGTRHSNVIVHSDIEDSGLPIELPPEYSENRAPLPGFGHYNEGSSFALSISNSRTRLTSSTND